MNPGYLLDRNASYPLGTSLQKFRAVPSISTSRHSFKSRGIGVFIRKAVEEHGPQVHLIVASSGNAGYAAACAASHLRVKCTVYIPEGVPQRAVDLLKDQKAQVIVVGKIYLETSAAAKRAVDDDTNAEISTKLDKPDAIFVSVGGGGMLGGVITGCKKVGWDDVPIITLETIGCNCFHHSFLLNTDASSDFATKLPPSTTKVHDEGENIDMVHFHEFSSKASGS
ncbi:hypothetical protein MPER_05239, partial [Moniliophthora perniciosa FA553]